MALGLGPGPGLELASAELAAAPRSSSSPRPGGCGGCSPSRAACALDAADAAPSPGSGPGLGSGLGPKSGPESGFGLASAELAAAPRSPLRSAGRGCCSRAVRVLDADDAAPSAAAPAESAPGATAAWTAVAAPDARAASGSSRLVSAESLPGVASSVADWPPSTLSELAAAPRRLHTSARQCSLPARPRAAASAACCFFADPSDLSG